MTRPTMIVETDGMALTETTSFESRMTAFIFNKDLLPYLMSLENAKEMGYGKDLAEYRAFRRNLAAFYSSLNIVLDKIGYT